MRRRTALLLFWFTTAAALAGTPGGPEEDPAAEARRADERLLELRQLKTDGAALVAFFRERTLSAAEEAELQTLVEQLGDMSYAVRTKASKRLVEIGARARPALRRALRHGDLETVTRVELLLKQIPAGDDGMLSAAAARLLAHHKPAGAAEALLAYLPFAADDDALDDIQFALAKLALAGGKPAPALLAALKSERSYVRGVAAEALGRGGARDATEALLKLLADPDPLCRLHAATGLLHLRHKDAVPVLIGLLTDLPRHDGWRAEELLLAIAGDDAPKVSLTVSQPSKAQGAWRAWWKANEAAVDLAKVDLTNDSTGLLVVAMADVAKKAGDKTGKVVAYGADGKPRWEITGLMLPVDVKPVGKNRLLIVDSRAGLVTERDFRGNVLWEHKVPTPMGAQRLPNGHTLIVTRNRIFTVDRAGTETDLPVGKAATAAFISGAVKLRDGTLVVRTRTAVEWYDSGGKLVKSFAAGTTSASGSGLCVLPNRHVLTVNYSKDGRVVEYSPEGNEVWSATCQTPISAVRLPNGNTLAASLTGKKLVEFNRAGQEVRVIELQLRPYCVTRF